MTSKIELCCDYIGDASLLRAVLFSIKMIRSGTPPPLAHYRAARYYKVRMADVAKYCGQHAVRIKENRRGLDSASAEQVGHEQTRSSRQPTDSQPTDAEHKIMG